jgi:hypothetical protein
MVCDYTEHAGADLVVDCDGYAVNDKTKSFSGVTVQITNRQGIDGSYTLRGVWTITDDDKLIPCYP